MFRITASTAALVALFAAVSGCSSAPQAPQESPKERSRREVIIGGELARQLESQLKIRREPEISAYVGEIARSLMASDPELRDSPVGVSVINGTDARWKSCSLPGIRVYLSAAILKNVAFENELASAVSLELGHVRARNVIEQLRRIQAGTPQASQASPSIFEGLTLPQPGDFPTKVDFFGPSGIFSYTDDQLLAALSIAVELMYSAGYDPRGMVSLLSRYLADGTISPYERSTLVKLIERTREIIAQHAPLRNPIVRSDRFLAIQKRMRSL